MELVGMIWEANGPKAGEGGCHPEADIHVPAGLSFLVPQKPRWSRRCCAWNFAQRWTVVNKAPLLYSIEGCLLWLRCRANIAGRVALIASIASSHPAAWESLGVVSWPRAQSCCVPR